jgi:hypothetical protein
MVTSPLTNGRVAAHSGRNVAFTIKQERVTKAGPALTNPESALK